jgi:hypothetical protein
LLLSHAGLRDGLRLLLQEQFTPGDCAGQSTGCGLLKRGGFEFALRACLLSEKTLFQRASLLFSEAELTRPLPLFEFGKLLLFHFGQHELLASTGCTDALRDACTRFEGARPD